MSRNSHWGDSNMPPETDIAIAISKIAGMSEDLHEVKSTLKELAKAVGKLAVVEERQQVTNEALGRAFKELENLGSRVGALELQQPIQRQSSDMVQSAIRYIVAAVLGAFLAGIVRAPHVTTAALQPTITSK